MLRRNATLLAVFLAVAATAAAGTAPGRPGPGGSERGAAVGPAEPAEPTAPTGPVAPKVTPTTAAQATPSFPEEQQQVADIQAMFDAGKFDQAADAAKAYLAGARDEKAKTDAIRIIAESLRKKGDWRQAPGAYARLRDRFEKNSDDYVRYDAIYEVLRASPTGVYQAGSGVSGGTPSPNSAGAGDPASAPATGPASTTSGQVTLADDQALTEALRRLGTFRSNRLKSRVAMIRRGRTPQEVVSAFAPAAEEARQIFLLSQDVPPGPARELAVAAGARLQELAGQITAALRAKLEGFHKKKKFENPWSFTNIEKKEVQDTQSACKAMAEAEKTFQGCLFYVSGTGEWADGDRLRSESSARQSEYDQLAAQFVVPKYTSIYGW